MNTKEKLELLWKYLFLAVIATGIFRFTDRHHPSSSFPLHLAGNHDMLFVGDDKVFFGADDHKMDVKVEQEIVDGDTIMKVWINGEEVDAEENDMKGGSFEWKSKDGKIIVIDIDDDHHDGEHTEKTAAVAPDVHIIKKKIIIRDKN